MTTVISTPADREKWKVSSAGSRPGASRLGGQPARNLEAWALLGVLLVAAVGFYLTWQAVEGDRAQVEADLASGQLINLNALRQASELEPLLTFTSDPAERSWIADRLWQHLARVDRGKAPNVGEIGSLRVTAADLESKGRRVPAPTLRARLADAEADSIRLLSAPQLAELKPSLVVRTPAEFDRMVWQALAWWLAAFGLVHLVWRWRRFPGDPLILPIVMLLTALGFMVMLSVRDPLRDLPLFATFAQGVALGAGLLVLTTWKAIDRRYLRQAKFPALAAAFLLSILLLIFGSGPAGSDAKVNLFGFQPVEIIKVLVVIFLAGYFGERWEFLRELKERRLPLASKLHLPRLDYALPPLIALGLVLFFFFLQRDLGPALVLIFLFLTLWAVARGRPWMVVAGTLAIGLAFWAGFTAGYPRTVTARIGMWLSPWDNFSRGGDHLAQSLWAFATGGATGTGFGLGQPGYVPEAHTDMVLAAIGEELGFFGLLTVLGLFGLLCWRMLRCAWRSTDAEGFFLGLGLALLTALPIVLICGGVTGLLPLSGVATPFVSYGRSSMLAQFMIVGLVLAMGARGAQGASSGKSAGTKPFADRFRRATTLAGLVILGVLGACLARTAWVMLVRADATLIQGVLTWQGDGSRRYRYNPRLQAIADQLQRGTIYDRKGVPLATNDLTELDAHQELWQKLGVQADVAHKGRKARYYPLGSYAFHLLGDARNQVNWAAENSSFVERDSRVRLQGFDDFARIVQIDQGPGKEAAPVIVRDFRELVPLLRHRHEPDHPDVKRILDRVRSVRMSIDARLQVGVARILEETVKKAEKSQAGAAILLDADTGETLASVSYPWPRTLPIDGSAQNAEVLLDRPRYGVYPPGSTFKLVTAMAALRLSPDLADRTFTCEALPGGRVGHAVRGFGKAIRDDPTAETPHGQVDLMKGITVSCNAYFAQLATYEVGPQRLLDTAFEFGITVARPNSAERVRLELPQSSYGQGQVLATPLQMARVAATIANGGQIPQGKWVLDDSNSRDAAPQPLLSAGQARLLRQAMRSVVTQGSARQLGQATPPIAGKTGTAEVQGKASHSWFVGFVPYGESERRYAFAVLVENGGYGGRVAAKAAGQMVALLDDLGYFDPEPDAVSASADPSAESGAYTGVNPSATPGATGERETVP